MKILAVCQYYSPEPMRFPDMCEEMVRRGHTVTVLTDVPNYPMGEIYPGYENGQNRHETINGVEVFRCATIPRKTGVVYRILNYFSFAISSWLKAGSLANDYDVVFVNQMSPVMMAWPGIRYARKHGKKLVMYCMDLWPASLSAGGICEGSLIYKVFGWLSKCIYRRTDRLLITSKMFRSYFEKTIGVEPQIIDYLPQYADAQFDEPVSPVQQKDTVDILFAGNVGVVQGIPTLLRAMSLLKEESALRLHIVGDGSELDNAKNLAAELELENVIFHGRKPLDDMPEYYAMADALIVSLTADPIISLTLPGKVQTYMAAGKPILGSAIGETPMILGEAGCGYCAVADDPEAFAHVVRQFLAYEDKPALGKNGRAYYEENFKRNLFMDKLERELQNHCNAI